MVTHTNTEVRKYCFEIKNTNNGSCVQADNIQWSPQKICSELEAGNVVYFPASPFQFSSDDTSILLNQTQSGHSIHKNISYRPLTGQVRGLEDVTAAVQIQRIMADYTNQATELLEALLTPYKNNWRYDYGSFRPIQEEGRKLRLRARNDLVHVDSFTTRYMHGDRILRVFVNLSPSVNRVWRTAKPFSVLAKQFKNNMWTYSEKEAGLRLWAKQLGFKIRPNYDRWMLDFHNFLKENKQFQDECRNNHQSNIWEFPPGSAWMVYTDGASHAVLSGQYAMEQTFIIKQQGLVSPEYTPIEILRALYH